MSELFFSELLLLKATNRGSTNVTPAGLYVYCGGTVPAIHRSYKVPKSAVLQDLDGSNSLTATCTTQICPGLCY